MKTTACILVQQNGRWRISVTDRADWETVELREEAEGEEWAEALSGEVADYAARRELDRVEVILALDTRATLAATLAVEEQEARHRVSLVYELEDDLPWSAEEMVADFVGHPERTLGVAVDARRWEPLVKGLEAQSLPVPSIGSAALMGMQRCASEAWWQEANGVLWCEAEGVHLVLLEQGRPVGWRWVSREARAVIEELRVWSETEPEARRWVVVNADDKVMSSLESLEGFEWQFVETEGLEEHARKWAHEVALGKEVPWLEWRREALATGTAYRAVRRAMAALVLAALLLAASWFGVLGYRTWENRRRVTALEQREVELYRNVMPGTRVPPAVLARLQSERARLLAARRVPADIRLPIPAIAVLHDFLAAMPRNVRVHVRELRIENGELDLHADLNRHADASVLVESLRAHHFEVPPPTTEQNGDGSVSVRLFARWQSPRKLVPDAGPSNPDSASADRSDRRVDASRSGDSRRSQR